MIPPPCAYAKMSAEERDRIRGRLGVPCEITHLRKRVDTRATYQEHRSKGGVFESADSATGCFAIM